MDLYGKNAAVTGASSGIGLELVKLLLDQGCRVTACAIDRELTALKSDRLFYKQCDISTKEEIDAFFAFSAEKLGGIDIYVSNAGFAYYEKIGAPDWDHAKAITDTNYLGMVYAAEKMKETHGDTPYAFVVTASAMGLLSLPGYALYCGTKAAVRGFADAYRHELEEGQRFQVVYPVATKTAFFKTAGRNTPVPWPTQSASVVAKQIIKGIRKEKNHIYPSLMFRVTSAINRVCPLVFKLYVDINDKAFRKWLAGKDD